jgi:hypothetical protein
MPGAAGVIRERSMAYSTIILIFLIPIALTLVIGKQA